MQERLETCYVGMLCSMHVYTLHSKRILPHSFYTNGIHYVKCTCVKPITLRFKSFISSVGFNYIRKLGS